MEKANVAVWSPMYDGTFCHTGRWKGALVPSPHSCTKRKRVVNGLHPKLLICSNAFSHILTPGRWPPAPVPWLRFQSRTLCFRSLTAAHKPIYLLVLISIPHPLTCGLCPTYPCPVSQLQLPVSQCFSSLPSLHCSQGTSFSAPAPQPQGTRFSAPAPQPQGTSFSAPAPQPQGTSFSAPAPQPQGTSFSAPAPQPQGTSFSAPAPQPQGTSFSAPAPQPLAPPGYSWDHLPFLSKVPVRNLRTLFLGINSTTISIVAFRGGSWTNEEQSKMCWGNPFSQHKSARHLVIVVWLATFKTILLLQRRGQSEYDGVEEGVEGVDENSVPGE